MSERLPSTALEALTTEMLGDIGLLHDSLEQLKRDVPAMTARIDEFLSKLSSGLNSPTLERFITARIGDIYIAARQARQAAEQDVQSAVEKAISDGWLNVRKRGDRLFEQAASEFVGRIGDATESAAGQAAASIAPLLTSLHDEIKALRKQRFRERWIASALACVGTGLVAGVACTLLTLLLIKASQT